MRVAVLLVVFTVTSLVARHAFAQPIELVSLGSASFLVDPSATTAAYAQTNSGLFFNGFYSLGDTLGGAFATTYDWSAYATPFTLALVMSVTGTNPDLPFSVELFDGTFNLINRYYGTTTGAGVSTYQPLTLALSGTGNFSSVSGLQFTWDGVGLVNAIVESLSIPAPSPTPPPQNLYVGSNSPSNTLNISVGGSNSYANTYVGFLQGSSDNSLTVRNPGATLTNSGTLTVGDGGGGNRLVVSDGALVRNTGGFIGSQASASSNSALVTGAGSLWSNSGDLHVGSSGAGNQLVISNGGIVRSANGYIGYGFTSSNNSATVTGSGSVWSNAATLYVGYLGTNNSLTVANGGTVIASGVFLGVTNGASGILNMGRFGEGDAGGTINTPSIALGAAGSRINFNQSNITTLSSSISGTGSLHQNGTGTTILTGLNTYSGVSVINGGTLQIGNGGTSGTIGSGPITNNGRLAIDLSGDLTLSSAISGIGSLHQNGTGTTILTGLNTYSGVSVINAGTLQIGNGGTTGTVGSGDITNNSRLVVNRSDAYTITNNIFGTGELIQLGGIVSVISGVMGGSSSLTKTGNGTLILTADNTYTGTTTIAGGTLQLGDETPTGSTGPGTILNNATLDIRRNNTFVLSNFITGSGQLRQIGSGTTVIAGSNNYSGVTRALSGALNLGHVNALSGSTLDMNASDAGAVGFTLSNQTYNLGGLQGSRALALSNGNTISVGANNASTTYSGSLSGNGGLTKTGTGSLTLSGSSSHTGTTTISSGALVVNGSAASSTFTVSGSGVLGGSGIIGAVNVGSGGTLAPGSSIESLHTGALSFTDGSTLAMELNSASVNADLVVVSGGLSLDGNVTLTLNDVAASPTAFALNTTFSLINYSGAWNGGLFTYGANPLANGATFTAGANLWQIVYNAPSGGTNFVPDHLSGGSFVNINSVPEPSTYALLLMSGVSALWWARRRGQ
jgi:fibronectin-binding autotransporter adhesin